eukprot:gene12700-3416_t
MDVKKKTRYKMLVKDLPVEVLLQLSRHLNPRMPIGGDWWSLAGAMGYKMIDILNFELKPDPTLSVLRSWWSNENKYVSDLLKLVGNIRRADVTKLLKPHEFCVEPDQKQPSDAEKTCLENDLSPSFSRLLHLPLENGHSDMNSAENLAVSSSVRNSLGKNGTNSVEPKGTPTESSFNAKAYVVSGETVVSDESQDELEEEVTHSENGATNVTDMCVQTQVPSPTAALGAPQFPTPEGETTRFDIQSSERLTAPNDKIALVIGNQNYKKPKYNQLSYTRNDAYDIASALEDLKFKVISLVDLTLTEMRTSMLAFCRLLGSGIYAVIYYAGHGFELDGENYLLPVDAMSPDPNESIRAQEFLQEMQSCDTLLNLMFLDCCRTRAKDNEAPRCSLKRGRQGNTIIAYSCCTQHVAFEEPNQKNGVYARYLLKNIRRDVRIENILMDVSTAVVQSRSVAQRPTYESDAYMECRLTAPILILEEDIHKLKERCQLWQEGNSIPAPMTIEMDSAVIKLYFHRAFSNVMITEIFVTNTGEKEIKNFRFSVSACEPLDVNVMSDNTDIEPMGHEKYVGGFRILQLQKLWNESLFLSIEFQTDEDSVLKKIDFGTPLITGITGSFHEWIKDRKSEALSGAKSSWI